MATSTTKDEVSGISENQPLVRLLNRAARLFPDSPALIDAAQVLTWAQARDALVNRDASGDGPIAQALVVLSDLARGEVFYFVHTTPDLPSGTDLVFGAKRADGSIDAVCHAAADAAHMGTALAKREQFVTEDRVALAATVSDPGFWTILAACMVSGATLDLTGDLSRATTGWTIDPEAVATFTTQPHLKRLYLRTSRDRLAEIAAVHPDTRIVNGLSLPATMGLILSSDPRDPAGTVTTTHGRPLGGVEVMIVDPRTGMDVLLYQTGEVWLRGTGIARGYAGRPRARYTDRFYRTGILGHLDSEGRLVLPRAEEMAVLSGW